jgi:hypothetical protein
MTPSIDSKKQARLVKSIGLNVFVLILLLALVFLYILPAYEEIATKKSELQALNTEFINLKIDGVNTPTYEILVVKYAGIKKTGALSPEDKDLTDKALKKTGPAEQSYMDWIDAELSKNLQIDDEIKRNERIIGGAIPTYSELNGDKNDTFSESQISLGDLSNFVERVLLKKHSLESFSPIGFGSITFENKANTLLNIGSYKLALDIRGKNKNIINFIDAVQTSGTIGIKDGKLVEPTNSLAGSGSTGGRFDNLLMSFDSLTTLNSFEDPEKDNTLNATLVFFVRARNYNDLVAIR